MKMDMTKGSPLKMIILFAIPLFFSNLFQQFYNVADTAIVGHILGDHALSSVGAVSTIYGIMTSFCFGSCMGFAILLSQAFGAGDMDKLKKGIAASIELAIGIVLIFTTCGALFMKPLMRMIKVSDTLFEDGYSYIIVITCGLIVTVLYNLLSAILRAVGNSKIPLLFLTISSTLNIGLDFLFIKAFGLGIQGAAYATVLAQGISAILCLIYIGIYCKDLIPHKEDFTIPKTIYKSLLSLGCSMALMFTIVNIGTLILQIGINGLGDDVVAAHVTARKISEICMMLVSTITAAQSTFTSQNFGAGKMYRIRKSIMYSMGLLTLISTFIILMIYAFGAKLVILLTGTDNGFIISTAVSYLRTDTLFYYALSVLCLLRNVLQGISHNGITLFASILEMIGKAITVLFFVGPFGYTAIIYCEPITWIICSIPVVWATWRHLYAASFETPEVLPDIAQKKVC